MKFSHYSLLALLALLTTSVTYAAGHSKEPPLSAPSSLNRVSNQNSNSQYKLYPRTPGGIATTSSSTAASEYASTAVFPSTQSVWLSYHSGPTQQRIYYCSAPNGKPFCEKVVDVKK